MGQAEARTPAWLAQFLGMEQSATEIRAHEPMVVGGLLQTPEYAADIARSVGVGPPSEDYARRNAEQRALRQPRVNDGSLTLHVVQTEMALRLQIGTPATMAAQMAKLADMSQRPNVTYQVVPFSVGQYEAQRIGSFSIMSHPWVLQGHTVCHLTYRGLNVIDDADDAAAFIAAFDQAAAVALSPDDTRALVDEARQQWEALAE